MGDMVIVAYRPKPGADDALLDLVRDHAPFLRRLGLATDRPALIMRGAGGVIVELFEWVEGGVARAHAHADILALWGRYASVCDYVPLHALPEAREMFATFAPVD